MILQVYLCNNIVEGAKDKYYSYFIVRYLRDMTCSFVLKNIFIGSKETKHSQIEHLVAFSFNGKNN